MSEKEAIKLSVTDIREFEDSIRAHPDQVVVVDLWALWCEHCIAELPQLTKLNERFGDRVHTISFNVDFSEVDTSPSETLIKQVHDQLKELDMSTENVLCRDPMDDVFDHWNIFSLPAVLIFDPQGNQHQRFDAGVDYESQVVPAIEQLLSDDSETR